MNEMTNHSEIMLSLGRLEGQASSTNQHLAQLNSKVANHEGRLNHMDVEDGKLAIFLKGLEVKQIKDSSFRSKWLDRLLMMAFMGILQLCGLLLIRSGIINLETTPSTPQAIQQRVIDLQAEAAKLQAKSQEIK